VALRFGWAVSVDLVMLCSIRKKSAAPTALVVFFSSRTQCLRTGLTSVAPPALGLARGTIHWQFMDCQRGGISDMLQDSGSAERTRASEAEDFVGRRGRNALGAFGRGGFAGAGVAGEFEPGIAGVDGRRAWD
jgi:hypothetical protein